VIQACRACGALQYYPRGVCGACWSSDLVWRLSAGRGTVYTFTVTRRSQAPGFRDELPYVLAYVELDEGVQVLTNLVGADASAIRIGMRVAVTFEDVSPEISIPRFRPLGPDG
jgi:uncharacterized OB-fold protein